MSELNVTPGVWSVDDAADIVVWVYEKFSDGSTIKRLEMIATLETENPADAHLMAASKELYEALVLAREYASEEIARRQDAGMGTSLDVEYLKQIDAALAKARGEAPTQ